MSEEPQVSRIRIVVLDDHGLFGASLARLLASEPGLEVAGECGSSDEALEVLKRSAVKVVLLDFDLDSERGNAFIAAARKAGYQGQFFVVCRTPDAGPAAMALRLGVSGIFLKSEAPDRLVHAIRMVAGGDVWIEPKIIQMLADQLVNQSLSCDMQPSPTLGDRERNVLLGILAGLTNKKIGENLGLSESAVKNIVQKLFGKAGVKKRSQLVRVALEGSLGAAQQLINRHSFSAGPKLVARDLAPVGQSHG